MSTKRIDGIVLEKMIRNGLMNLCNSEMIINRMNVFPVADGDTGTNMVLTLRNGLNYAESDSDAGNYLKMLSEGLILGARGNSGVILSQLFRGIYLELARCGSINPREMAGAFVRAYHCAYKAVRQPAEGTVLTVAKEGIEYTRYHVVRGTTMEDLFELYVARMNESLARTPELLKQLKDAGVVDSGAKGYILIVEGMLKFLYGEVVEAEVPVLTGDTAGAVSSSVFNEDSRFELGYCMEFVLQLLKGSGYNSLFKLENYISELDLLGDSIVATEVEGRVKVHIHTKKPARIITISQEYGEFVTFKLENMQIQHNEKFHEKPEEEIEPKPVGIIAEAAGAEFEEVLKGLGCDIVIHPGKKGIDSGMLLSTLQRFPVDAVLLMVNKPDLKKAELAAGASGKKITILPFTSMAQMYFALAMDDPESEDADLRAKRMLEGGRNVMALCLKAPEAAENEETVSRFLQEYPEAAEKETCVLFAGSGAGDPDAMTEMMQRKFPDAEIDIVQAGQTSECWMVGLT